MLTIPVSATGPVVVLVHGVGVGPESFVNTAAALQDAGRTVHCVVRPGYEPDVAGGRQPVDLDIEVDRIIETVEKRKERSVVWVGVSGGATLGVIAAGRRPVSIESAILHEPLVGSTAVSLHDAVQTVARELATGPADPATREARATQFVSGLVGPAGWEALGQDGRALVATRAQLIAAEVPLFAAFEADEISDDAVRVVITVGERSPAARHEAAARAADLLHGEVVVIPGVGHLPQVEAPELFAEIIRSNS
jgi:pimeloyl-ACP methyl ester carboxylesterase